MRIQHQTARKAENFPVASRLLPKGKRDIILIFYDFVRGLDDIADNGALPAKDRADALRAVKEALTAGQHQSLPPWASAYGKACAQGRIRPAHGDKLMQAFLQDTQKLRYASWEELIDYCNLSAAPVGHFMLDSWGENSTDRAAADALCQCLQILNHLQDAKEDYSAFGRVYLPQDLITHHGASEEQLSDEQMGTAMRAVYDDLLVRCDRLLDHAQSLMRSVSSRRFRLEIGWIYLAARALSHKLKSKDAFATKVRLSKVEYALCLLRAMRWL